MCFYCISWPLMCWCTLSLSYFLVYNDWFNGFAVVVVGNVVNSVLNRDSIGGEYFSFGVFRCCFKIILFIYIIKYINFF